MSDSDLLQEGPVEPDEADTSQAAPSASAQPPGGGKPPTRPKNRSMMADPVVRALVFVALGLVVLYLVTIVSALVQGIFTPAAPRTALEKNLDYYSQITMQQPRDTSLWHGYIEALIQDGQYDKAQTIIDQATKAIDQKSTQDILAGQVELYFATKNYDKAISTADLVRKNLRAYYDAAKKKQGSPEQLGQEISDNYGGVLLIKAEALIKLNRLKEAEAAFTEYMKGDPSAADVQIRRGVLRLQMGDKAGAKSDFEAALKFLPGDPTATAGLKQIGASK